MSNKAPDENDRFRAAGAEYDPEAGTIPYSPPAAPQAPQAPRPKKTKPAKAAKAPDSQAMQLVEQAEKHSVELFRCAGSEYAAVQLDGRRATFRLPSADFGALLVRWLWEASKRPVKADAVKEAQTTLAARARFGDSMNTVYVRCGKAGDALYLDLADGTGRAVEITAQDWRIIEHPPVYFVRAPKMEALPAPCRGGNVADLFQLINLPEETRPLLLAWLVAGLRPDGPFPVLAVHGEQGSGKTTACKMIRALVDPHSVPLRSPPRDERNLYIAARHTWLLGFDNLSSIPIWLSDALCCIATGGHYSVRGLHTDDTEISFSAKQPIVLNGVEEVVTRADLLERCLVLFLPAIPKTERRNEAELWAEFRRLHPLLLGALLDAVVCALRRLPSLRLEESPRMADFALWVTAAEPALGYRDGAIVDAYFQNLRDASDLPLEASLIAAPLRMLVEKLPATLDGERRRWTGTATELLAALRDHADEPARQSRDWPRNGQALSGQLKRLAPNLRQNGIHVELGRRAADGKRTREIKVWGDR